MSVTAAEARTVARQWAVARADLIPGFIGAYTVGSINDLADDALVPATSDVDMMVVVDSPQAPPKPGKMIERGVILEVTYLALDDVRDPDRVLGHYHLAAGVRSARILSDPTDHLAELQSEVRSQFAHRHWVQRRCEMAQDTVTQRLDSIDPATPIEAQAMPWLFAAGGVPHVLLVAGLKSPTVRRRFGAVRALLQELGEEGMYPGLLGLMGAERLSAQDVSRHLDALEGVFDAASGVIRSPFFFASDIRVISRPIAIDGSRELIRAADHREAMFWVAVTFTRCRLVLRADASGKDASIGEDAYRAMLGDLGIRDAVDIRDSAWRIRHALPDISEVAGRIMDATIRPA